MPDLTIEHVCTCPSNLHWHTKIKDYDVTYGDLHVPGDYQMGWTCTCPHFKFRKQECKHIAEAKLLRCGWGEDAFCGGRPEPTKDGKCPDCGEPVEVIKIGV